MGDDRLPLFWRMRGTLQRGLKWVALGVMLLGAYVTVAAIVVGPLDGIAAGLGLLVGGALIFVVKAKG